MRLIDLPADERPRERLLAHGPVALGDAELLAICLGSGRRGLSAVEFARELLASAGGLAALLARPADELVRVVGLGPARTCQIKAGMELARRVLAADLRALPTLSRPSDCADYLGTVLAGRPYEVFLVVFLDQRHRVLTAEELFRGTIDGAAVYPRELVKRALALNAAALICAHNHPSGVAEPSHADIALTRRLRDALALVEVRLLDHFVLGMGSCTSLAERGLV